MSTSPSEANADGALASRIARSVASSSCRIDAALGRTLPPLAEVAT
jgi:hypothetical protein